MEVEAMTLSGGTPKTVTVTMTIEEVLAIAALFGKFNGYALQRLDLPDRGDGPYGCLVGEVINRYWDGGLAEVGPKFSSLNELNFAPGESL